MLPRIYSAHSAKRCPGRGPISFLQSKMFLYGEENIVDMNKHDFVGKCCQSCRSCGLAYSAIVEKMHCPPWESPPTDNTQKIPTDNTQKIKDLRYVLGTLDRILTIGYLEETPYLEKETSKSYQIIVDILNGHQEEK